MNTAMTEGTPEIPRLPLDPAQFELCLRAALPGLTSYARSLARDQDAAQDLVQETAFRVWRARSRFVAGTSFKAWSYSILRNCFLSNMRQQRTARTETRGDDLPDVPVAPGQEAAIDLKDLARCWRRLNADQRRSLMLVAIEGHSYEEAAAMEMVPLGTMKSRVTRARHALLSMLDDQTAWQEDGLPQTDHGVVHQDDTDRQASTPLPEELDRVQIDILRAWRERRRVPPLRLAA